MKRSDLIDAWSRFDGFATIQITERIPFDGTVFDDDGKRTWKLQNLFLVLHCRNVIKNDQQRIALNNFIHFILHYFLES